MFTVATGLDESVNGPAATKTIEVEPGVEVAVALVTLVAVALLVAIIVAVEVAATVAVLTGVEVMVMVGVGVAVGLPDCDMGNSKTACAVIAGASCARVVVAGYADEGVPAGGAERSPHASEKPSLEELSLIRALIAAGCAMVGAKLPCEP